MRAVAYTCDMVHVGGCVIDCRRQTDALAAYAAENNIEIGAWFTDEQTTIDPLERPGIRALLSWKQPYEKVLCERIGVLGASIAALDPFLKELDRIGVILEPAVAWDHLAQLCRRRSRSLPIKPVIAQIPGYRVAKPARLHFDHLLRFML
ncbi:MAG: recombinase family protein [Acidobacteria bacterium]|nr:recombinase family protein [Acidobacteriota bacterium]